MAKDASFDIFSTVDMQEVDNAVNQANKEIGQRYDFKNSKSTIEMEGGNLKVLADDDYKLRSVIEILKAKLVGRKVPVKNLVFEKAEPVIISAFICEIGMQTVLRDNRYVCLNSHK